MPSNCCVQYCKNYNRKNLDNKIKFYRFPAARYKVEQRKKWIAAVERKNSDGTPWEPRPHDLICSQHFVNNEKSNNMFCPNYVPTIFPDSHGKLTYRKNKYRLVMKKVGKSATTLVSHVTENQEKTESSADHTTETQTTSNLETSGNGNKNLETRKYKLVMKKMKTDNNISSSENPDGSVKDITKDITNLTKKIKETHKLTSKSPECATIVAKAFGAKSVTSKVFFNKKCQMYTFGDSNAPEEKTFLCDRYIYVGTDYCDVSTQTDMFPNKNKLTVNDAKVLKDKMGGQDKVNVLVAGRLRPDLLANLRSLPKKL